MDIKFLSSFENSFYLFERKGIAFLTRMLTQYHFV